MAKIAIDVALIPSEEMMEKAIEINKELLKTNDDKIVLGKEQNLPHISLAMGVIDEEQIPEVEKILEEIASKFSVLDLDAISVRVIPTPNDLPVSDFKIENTEELQSLHEIVMKKLFPLMTYDVALEMVYEGKEDVTLYWIKNYAKKHDNPLLFSPHITLGCGKPRDINLPIKFTADRIILAHLGNYCTCRKVLVTKTLKTPTFSR